MLETVVLALQMVNQAAIIFDQFGNVLAANTAAESLVGLRSNKRPSSLKDTLINELINSFNSEPTKQIYPSAIQEIKSEAFTIRAANIAENRYLVLINPPPMQPTAILKKAYSRLTETELAVAALLFEGRPVEEIALKRQVAPNTIRAQLKSIFEKTETRSQAHLVTVMMKHIFKY